MGALPDRITITELSQRSGVAASALRYYGSLGLIPDERTAGNQRRYRRSVLRRVAVIKVAQSMGVPLERVQRAFASLPNGQDPTLEDWERLSAVWRDELDRRIGLHMSVFAGVIGLEGAPQRSEIARRAE